VVIWRLLEAAVCAEPLPGESRVCGGDSSRKHAGHGRASECGLAYCSEEGKSETERERARVPRPVSAISIVDSGRTLC